MLTIGQRIKSLREQNNMSLAALAEVTGLKKSGLSSYENDKYEPSARATIALSEAFKVSTDWILTGQDHSISEPVKEVPSIANASIVLSNDELELIAKFRQLDRRDQEDAKGNIDMKYERTASFKRGTSLTLNNGESGEEAATHEAV